METVLYFELIHILMGRTKQLNCSLISLIENKFLDKFVGNRDTFMFQTNLHSYGKT